MLESIEHVVIKIWNWLNGTRQRPQKEAAAQLTLGLKVVEGAITKDRIGLSQTRRTMHVAVLGKTGSGKSSLLKFACLQDIRAGRGFFFLDLHGDATPFLLSAIAAEEWRRQEHLSDRLIVISPADLETSVGLNPLEGLGEDFGRIAEFADVLRQNAHLDTLGVRTEELVRNAIAVLSANDLTLLELAPLLTDAKFRSQCLVKVANAEVRGYFESRYGQQSAAMQATMREPVLNKVSAFTADPRFRHVVGQARSTFSLKESMDSDCWVIAQLPKGKLGGQTLTFAALLFTAIKNAVFTREQKELFTLYLDELQNLVAQSSDVETVLSEARKFGVGIVAANQFLDQYPPSMRAALLSVANHVFFQLSSTDAVTAAQMLDGGKPLSEQLKNLPQRHFIAKRGADHWMHAVVPTVENTKHSYRDLLERSRARYAVSRATIEASIAERHKAIAEKPNEALNDWD